MDARCKMQDARYQTVQYVHLLLRRKEKELAIRHSFFPAQTLTGVQDARCTCSQPIKWSKRKSNRFEKCVLRPRPPYESTNENSTIGTESPECLRRLASQTPASNHSVAWASIARMAPGGDKGNWKH